MARQSRIGITTRLVFLYVALAASPALAQPPINIEEGSGSFEIAGSAGRESKTLTIYYHRPANFTADSSVLIVVPGAGRNAWSYRDAWVEASEEHAVLVLSPHYSEQHYPEFWSYNLAGMLTNVELNSDGSDIQSFDIDRDPRDWIFLDFDRLFEIAKASLPLSSNTYDIFGHSAGGQIIHRLALFRPNSKARRLVAANSGWYTVPTLNDEFPYGVAGILSRSELVDAFKADLVVFLGELDNRNETRGDLARTPTIDIQGLSRIERGRYFHAKASDAAAELDAKLNWKLEVVPGIGHDYRRMSEAAAKYLYE
jgi:pimeloyl-ACP methyl ester carboxylesterase